MLFLCFIVRILSCFNFKFSYNNIEYAFSVLSHNYRITHLSMTTVYRALLRVVTMNFLAGDLFYLLNFCGDGQGP